MNSQCKTFKLQYSGTLKYEFNSFRDRARTSICSYDKANFRIDVNANAINPFHLSKCQPIFYFWLVFK